ncbi:hypothetical protein AVEN_71208-1 [Araneus ventricosus]|uniref:Uncharacterized protein n=1 Tax=Araneus ventricosus TaxID=182803 RepID=A0A4Y2V2A0_ARAVE|nr:hypothetical protein AVEN_71208-1 [Araneus ventricosus]
MQKTARRTDTVHQHAELTSGDQHAKDRYCKTAHRIDIVRQQCRTDYCKIAHAESTLHDSTRTGHVRQARRTGHQKTAYYQNPAITLWCISTQN